MKPTHLLQALLAVLTTGAVHAGFTYETPEELSSQADFNNDGHPDLAVLDRSTGVLRILTSLSGVSFSASANFRTGMDQVDSLSAGAIGFGRGAIAVASALDNRVQSVVPLTSTQRDISFGTRSFPGAVVLTGLLSNELPGPSGRAGNIFVSTDFNDAPLPRQLTRMSITTALFSTVADPSNVSTGQAAVLRRGNAVPWNGRSALGFMLPGEVDSAFVLYHAAGDPRSVTTSLGGLPPDAHWLHGDFTSAAGRTGFLFYQKDADTFRPAEILHAAPTGTPPDMATAVGLGAPIHLLMTVVRDGADGLLALLDGGTRAVLYDYQIGAAPVLRQSWSAPAGETFTMAAPLANGSFLLLSGEGGRSTHWQRYDADGPAYRKTIAGPVGCGIPPARPATLFYFSQEPFVSANAVLNRFFREQDWTDIGSGLLTPVTRYTDAGPLQGLSNPTGWFPTPGNYDSILITNQFTRTATAGQAPVSIATLSNRSGNVNREVRFDPPGGHYPPIRVTVTPAQGDDPVEPYQETFPVLLRSDSTAAMLYRLSPDAPWQNYAGPIRLSGSATVQAKIANTTSVQSAAYQFSEATGTAPPLELPAANDTNGNGLPDAWESAFAQSDPNADTDGDGFNALQEYQNGTDPRENFSVTPPPVVVPSPDFPLALIMETVPGSGGANHLRLSWSTNLHDAMLQGTDDLTNWSPVSHDIVIEGNRIVHYTLLPQGIPDADGLPVRRFYRLLRVAACP